MNPSKRHHIIISGTGRAGTTFLVQLLTAAGLNTGFTSTDDGIFENCRAGMEKDIRAEDAPYIVKDPSLCDYLGEVLEKGETTIDHAIIPMRNLFQAAESRRKISAESDPAKFELGVPGGLWASPIPEQQEQVLCQKLYQLLETLIRWEIPITFLSFPRLVEDPEYLYRHLKFLFPNSDGKAKFLECFAQTAQPHFVHNFTPKTS